MRYRWAKSCTVDWNLAAITGGPYAGRALIVSLYGPRDPILTPVGWTGPFHYGIDLWPEGFGDGTGAPLYALGPGVVTSIWNDPAGLGHAIEIEYTDPFWNEVWAVRYLHMAFAPLLARGSAVAAGTLVGYTGATGMAGGPHLHMEVRRTPFYYITDPLPWLQDCPDVGEPVAPPHTLTYTGYAGDPFWQHVFEFEVETVQGNPYVATTFLGQGSAPNRWRYRIGVQDWG